MGYVIAGKLEEALSKCGHVNQVVGGKLLQSGTINTVFVKTSHLHVTFFFLAPATFHALEYRSP
jgi:hypothetical protein